MSTEAERNLIGDILKRIHSPIIVELGAYGGEDSEWMREACGQCHELNVIVEPDHRNMEIIRKHRRGERTVLVEAAIADYTGMINFHEAEDPRSDGKRSGSGSIRSPRTHQALFPEISFTGPGLPVPCWSLDHLASSLHLLEISLLWVDIQGAERDMIAGGQMALSMTEFLFIEAEQTELYEGQALRDELLSLLPGFKVIQELDYNLLLEAK